MTRVLVGVVDSGWTRARRDARVRAGIGLVDSRDPFVVHRNDDDEDRNGHGTKCAEIILESAPGAEILPIRVFDRRLETSVAQLCAALEIAAEHGARVANLSLATLQREALVPLYAACEAASRRGVTIVAAADGRTNTGFPAVFANVIGVRAGVVESVSGYEPASGQLLDFIARGTDSGDEAQRGTNSFAAAVVSGAVADIVSQEPDIDLETIRHRLAERSARDRAGAVADIL